MRDFLQQLNYRFWANMDEIIAEFKMTGGEPLRKDEQDYIDFYTLSAVGKYASSLSEFYENAYLSQAKESMDTLPAKIDAKMNTYTEKAQKSMRNELASKRDNFELILITNGYIGDTFATASNAIYKSMSKQTAVLGNALDQTIDSFYKLNADKIVKQDIDLKHISLAK